MFSAASRIVLFGAPYVSSDDRKARLAAERGVVKPHKLAHIVRRTGRFEELRSEIRLTQS